MRLALKLATGAGKTTVMAMIIAWQTINAVRRQQSNRFSRGFLVDDLSDVKKLLEYNAELEFARAEIRPTSGVTNLDFVELAVIAIEGAPVYGCSGDCPTGELAVQVPTSATQYFAAESLAIQMTVTGALPHEVWTVDLDVCVRGNASYSLAP